MKIAGKPRYYFHNHYNVHLMHDYRLKLPVAVVRQLEDAGVSEIWLGPTFLPNGIVLCPVELWSQYIKETKDRLPFLGTTDGEILLFPMSSQQAWDDNHRIYISTELVEHAGISPSQATVMIGRDSRFEIWKKDRFEQMLKDCNQRLQEPKKSSDDQDAGGNRGTLKQFSGKGAKRQLPNDNRR